MEPSAGLRSFAKFTFLFAQVLGFLPFALDTRTLEFRRKTCHMLYPGIFVSCLGFGVLISSVSVLSELVDNSFSSDTANVLLVVMSALYVACLVCSYAEHYIKLQQLEELVKDFTELCRTIGRLKILSDSPYTWLLTLCVLRTLILLVNFSLSLVKYKFIDAQADNHAIQHVILIIPSIIIEVVPNLLYVCNMLVFYLFREINGKLHRMIASTIALESESGRGAGSHFRCQRAFCEFSDSVDAIADVHLRLCQVAQRLNELIVNFMGLWTAYKLLQVLLQIFTIYLYATSKLMIADFPLPVSLVVALTVGAIGSTLEGATMGFVCHSAMSESQKGVEMVQDHYFIIELDVRYSRSIQMSQLSMQIIQHKLVYNAWGMYTIDCTLVFAMITTTISYLLILIQFELAQKKHDNR